MKMSLVVAVACAFALGTTALLPADLSPIGSVYAKGGGGGGGGNGGGNGGGHGGGNAGGNGGGHGGGKGGPGGNHGSNSNGANDGGEHAGKATRDHGLSGNHYGSTKNDSKGHGQTTSSVAHSKDTRGLSKATAISATTPGTHNTKGLEGAGDNSSKHDDD
ncbi:hypothetical protein [Pseudomonas nitroreducens]|uniref:Glycine-rich protein n=1 Tax=Pseudomonas nitroreducens TaxID=46680 RepID=A0A6G6J4P0_PSENT|nr:hypothetical protein [Pseudomonas nitroreducens]QIE90020.1 hypothetical protein G5B91_28725 [Pseudomonas nitroreducens]